MARTKNNSQRHKNTYNIMTQQTFRKNYIFVYKKVSTDINVYGVKIYIYSEEIDLPNEA